MQNQVSHDFLRRVMAECPKGSVTIIAFGKSLYELVNIKHGSLFIRGAAGFKLTEDEPVETEDLGVTGYWYLPKEEYLEKNKAE
jgi:hypothetical protein